MALEKPKKLRLGDLLVEHAVISADQLRAALEAQKQSGHKLGRVLIEIGCLGEDQLLDFLARQLAISFIDLRRYDIKPEVVRLIPEVQARRFRVIALDDGPEGLLIGMADPTDLFAYDEISRQVRRPLRLAVVKEADLLRTVDAIYRRTTEISGFAAELEQQLSAHDVSLRALAATEGQSDAPVVKLLQTMFDDAVQVNASDIHIEPDEHELRIRFRLDGVLRVQTTAERRIAGALISRLKLMAGLDISEKRLPQDGRFNIRVQDKSIDVRLSTMPLPYGESAVLRLLNQSSGMLDLENLGMPSALLERLRVLLRHPHGMLLVTGPTGSGKTTTLYAALKELNTPAVKIITVEDPVEYRLRGINQVQVNPKIDLGFGRVLRSILRQDPDIILIGEMRDKETAEIGLRAAMTGHFVLSTLHTNDAVSTPVRLMDMGAEPYLIGASLRGVLAQRLVRRICDSCAEPAPLDAAQRAVLEQRLAITVEGLSFRRGRGCTQCNESGYQGRIGVYELLEMDHKLTAALHTGDVMGFAQLATQRPGYHSLKHNAVDLAARGFTTVQEVLRVAYGGEL